MTSYSAEILYKEALIYVCYLTTICLLSFKVYIGNNLYCILKNTSIKKAHNQFERKYFLIGKINILYRKIYRCRSIQKFVID